MSQLHNQFFAHLAQKLPALKRQYAETRKKEKLKRNGHQFVCSICGAQFMAPETQIVLQTTKPIEHCPTCDKALSDGNAAFVTLERKPRYWIGKGTHSQYVGKVTVVTSAQMDSIERINAAIEKSRAKLAEAAPPEPEPCPMCHQRHDQRRPCFSPEPPPT